MWWTLLALAHLLGLLTSIDAVSTTRTSQGAIAWAISLVTVPYLSVPIYWVFGRRRFSGYVEARRRSERELASVVEAAADDAAAFRVEIGENSADYAAMRALAETPFLTGNHAELLVDGEAAFESIFEGIAAARHYVLAQFFIVRDDGLGRRFQQALIDKAREGVAVLLLYDEIGSRELPKRYKRELEDGGVEVSAFNTTQGRRNRFQLNFRNHRKIVVVDGFASWTGGLNVADEYLGLDPRMGAWRDTFVRLEGPATLLAQRSFLFDWYWATGRLPSLHWRPRASERGDVKALVMATAPTGRIDAAQLAFVHALNTAESRIWIASPYFVPDQAVIAALELAALRGVDVRVLMPEKPDHLLVWLSAWWFVDELDGVDIGFYHYRAEAGFMHQKVLLVDDRIATVGTANFDNRSFRLNFEVTAVVFDREFASRVEAMLEADFGRSKLITAAEVRSKPLWFLLAVRFARLTAPLQ